MKNKINNVGVQELTNGEFENYIKNGVVLIDFFADWCMPCVMMGPVVEELSEKFNGKIKFGKVNIEDNQAISNKFGIRSIPNFILFKDGKQIANFVGAISEEDFEDKLNKFL
jgi:thioredoxin 1